MSNRTLEDFALTLSRYGYATMAVAGLVFAGLTGSGAILLDGAYSLVSFLMVLLARRVAQLVEQPDSEDFQFGYAYFEPLLNSIRGLLILVLVAFGVGSAVLALFSGGRVLNSGMALIYSVLIAAICLSLAAVQRRHARQTASPLLQVDAHNWLIDGMLTVAVGIAFGIAFVLQRTPWAGWVVYIDPALMEIAQLDCIRERVAEALSGCHPRLVLDVVFTADERWILGFVDERTALPLE